jgi:hypothetical protein
MYHSLLKLTRRLLKHKRAKAAMWLVATGLFITNVNAQTSTEQFETETPDADTFTDNGVTFRILSKVGTYDIQAGHPGTGWNGTAADNRYIDNSGLGNQSAGTSFSIKTTSNLFKVNRFWVYCAAGNGTLGVAGTLTITAKLTGVTKFTQTKTTGFNATTALANGFTLIDLTNLNGQNYSNIVIDEIQITADGNFQYLALDAFTWVKDSNLVLLPVTLTSFTASLNTNGLLKANWKTAAEKNNSHFILQGSADGKTWKDLARKNAAENAVSGASYELETNIGTMTLAGFGLLGLLLLPFTNKRYRMFAFLVVVAVVAVACAKDKDSNNIDLSSEKSLNSNTIYLRLAQVDLDGTTTYSEPIPVKAK